MNAINECEVFNYPYLETCRKIAHLFQETEMVIDKDGSLYLRERFSFDEISECVSCPNLAEMLERLPSGLEIYKGLNHYAVMYKKYKEPNIHNESLPEALGLLLIKLDEEGIL